MCTDCGCSIRGMEGIAEEVGEHSHDGGKTFHTHGEEGHSHSHEHAHESANDSNSSGEHQKAHEHLHHNPQ